MAIGYFSAQVFTSRSIIPIEGATITVSIESEKGREIKGFRTTNTEGLSTSIELETPDIDLSLSPSKAKPFTSCTVKIYHPDYYVLLIDGAQVFAEQKSIQRVGLVPLKEFEDLNNQLVEFQVPPQDL